MKVYKHVTQDIMVYKDEAEYYAMEQLGINIKPMGVHGTYTQEQIDFMCEFRDWYFSGNWFEDEIKEAM